MKNRSLFSMLTTISLGLTLALGVSLNIIQNEIQEVGASTEYVARQVFQMNRIRYKSGQPDGIQSRWNDSTFSANIWDMSYGRVVLEASESDSYIIGLRYAADAYRVKVFVNGISADYDFPDNDGSNTIYNLTVDLNEGKNVFIAAIIDWGVINALILPDGVTLVDEDTSGGTYLAGYCDLQNTYLSYTGGGVHDPNAFVYTSELAYDGSGDWKSKAKFTVTTTDLTESVDLTYHCLQHTYGVSELAISINGWTTFNVSTYEYANGVLGTISISESTLTANGLIEGSNTIEITKPNNNDEKIGLISLELTQNEVIGYSTTRVEAEAATNSGGTIKGEGNLGNGNWSGSSYVGDMGTKNPLSSPSQISADLSNINYLSFSFTAVNAGTYDIFLRYANGADCVAHVRANQGSWSTLNLVAAPWWDTPRVARTTVNMQAGSQTIVVTGTTNDGGWANYDFVDIVQQGTLTDDEIAINYAIFFRDQTSAGCTAQNVSLIPWAQLKSEYLALSSTAKDAFVVSTNELALDAMARYQVLINRYSTLASDNWLVDGDGDPVYSSAITHGDLAPDYSVGLLIGLTIIVLSSIGLGFTIFRKRKSDY